MSAYDLTAPGPYLDLVKGASKSMAALAPDAVVDDGRTAAQLGRIDEWNGGKKETGGEFAKLGKPLGDPKPGKLAEALDYKSRVLPAPACTRTVTGPRNGPLTVTAGVTCLDRAAQRGPVVVRPGAALVVTGSTLDGPLQADRAAAVHLCGSRVEGPVSVSRSAGPVRVGGPGCTANTLMRPRRAHRQHRRRAARRQHGHRPAGVLRQPAGRGRHGPRQRGGRPAHRAVRRALTR